MLFSEPKIPQSGAIREGVMRIRVSVLFSEPKIPQLVVPRALRRRGHGFSALQRAENSSMLQYQSYIIRQRRVSVLFSEPKIPQYR